MHPRQPFDPPSSSTNNTSYRPLPPPYDPHYPSTTHERPLPPLPPHLQSLVSSAPSPEAALRAASAALGGGGGGGSSNGSTPTGEGLPSPRLPPPLPKVSIEAPSASKKRGRSSGNGGGGGGGGSRGTSPVVGMSVDGEEKSIVAATGAGVAPVKEKKKVKVGARASIACTTCRKRKVRCSAEWPSCAFCTTRNAECSYEGAHPAEHGGIMPGSAVPTTGGATGAIGLANFLSSPQTIEPILPSIAIQLEALEAFFLHHYDIFYFLHRPSLTTLIHSPTGAPKLLLCCILAFSSRHCSSLRSLHPSSPTAASEHYAALANQVLVTNNEITLLRVQCLLILGLYECTEGKENQGWLKIGYAIRMVQVLRLGFEDEHELPQPTTTTTNSSSSVTTPTSTSPSLPSAPPATSTTTATTDSTPTTTLSSPTRDPTLSETRRRTFWACFLLDRTVSDGKERPCSLHPPLSSTLRMPGSDVDFHSTKGGGGGGGGARFEAEPKLWTLSWKEEIEEEGRKKEGDGGRGEADLYGMTLRISELWQRTSTYINSGGRNIDRRAPWLPSSTFGTLSTELDLFEQRLPTVFKYSESNLIAHAMIGQGRLFGLMHLLFATSKLILHRDYLPFLPPLDFKAADGPIDGEPLYQTPTAPIGWWQDSISQAVRASGIITDTQTLLTSHGSTITHPFAGFAALAAGTMHLHLQYWPHSSSVLVNSAYYIDATSGILAALRDALPIATNWCEALAKLQLLYYSHLRGIVDVDPIKVRAGVIKLLRTVKEEGDDDGTTTTTTNNNSASTTPIVHTPAVNVTVPNRTTSTTSTTTTTTLSLPPVPSSFTSDLEHLLSSTSVPLQHHQPHHQQQHQPHLSSNDLSNGGGGEETLFDPTSLFSGMDFSFDSGLGWADFSVSALGGPAMGGGIDASVGPAGGVWGTGWGSSGQGGNGQGGFSFL